MAKSKFKFKVEDRSQYDEISNEDLFKEYSRTNEVEIRNELVTRYMFIPEKVARRYYNKGIDTEEIYQIACLGLIYAVERFDIEKGFKFSSFGTPTIIGEIKKFFRDKGWTIKVPRKTQELTHGLNKAKTILAQELQKTPTVYELADYLNITSEEVLETIEAGGVYTLRSLDIVYSTENDDGEISLSDLIGEEDDHFEEIENNDFLQRELKKLNDIEIKVLEDRFYHKKTQTDISEELGVSQMTVSRIEKRTVKKLKDEFAKIINK